MAYRYLPGLLFLLLSGPAIAQAPLEFVRNDGQWAGAFSYRATSANGDIYAGPAGFTYVVGAADNREKMHTGHKHSPTGDTLYFHAYQMTLEGANAGAEFKESKVQTHYNNYFLGSDQAHWKSGIHPALALDRKEIYPGTDLHLSSQAGWLKYDFILQPGADPALIRLRFDGHNGLALHAGKLSIKTSVGEVQELAPVAYQYGNEGRREVPCLYRLEGNVVSYRFPKGYDESLPLVIDPTVVFSTLTGSTADNWGYTATYDGLGNFYAGGTAFSAGYPTSTGAFQTTFAGGVNDPNFQSSDDHGVGFAHDIALIKYDPTGVNKIWATYIGGSDNEQPHSLIADGSGNLIIAGRTYSSDYPVTSGCYDASFNGMADIAISKLNASATALIGSTFVGGSGADGTNFSGSEYVYGGLKHNYGDDARSEVIIDNTGNIYVAGSTKSSNFPVTAGAYQSLFGGTQDGVVLKMNGTLTSLIYSTYFGGSNNDACYVLALNSNQSQLFVGGGTQSTNIAPTGSVWKNTYQGGSADGYIARFTNGPSPALQRITYIGTSGYDQVYGVQVGLDDNVYAMGQTLGGTFPVTPGVYSNPGSSQFILKMDNGLTTNTYSSVFGSGNSSQVNISPVAFLVDTCQNVYISGWGGNLGLPTLPPTIGTTTGMPVTAATITAPMKSTTDGFDFYFIVFSKNALSLLYGAYMGRTSTDPNLGEHVDGGTSRFDRQGVVYQGICANCGGPATVAFPTTPGVYGPTVGSTNCNQAALKIAFNLGAVDAVASANPNTKGCPPFTVQFGNTSTNAISYTWTFGDGSPPSALPTPAHTFVAVGTYTVRLIAQNPNACKELDTTFLTIIVDNNKVTPNFNYVVTDSCGPFRASFTNTSLYSPLPGSAAWTTFQWYFGDGTSFSGVSPGLHTFPDSGSYTVMLIMRDTAACNNPDTIRKTVRIAGFRVKAGFNSPESVCIAAGLVLGNSAVNASSYFWDFGDGQTSTAGAPVHTYAGTGSFTITQIVFNPASCNKRDTLRKTISIKSLPIADFTFAPVIPVRNSPTNFTNLSQNAVTYNWSFGDGSGSSDVNPKHQYKKTGRWQVCLVARTTEGCADTVCKEVESDIRTGIDLPTAFSPNGDGSNDILYVRGGAIETMNLKIFNRWGTMVFESNSLETGWDGTYKNKPMEMDAYGYVLSASFIDGTTAQLQGNVSLVR